jgi:hypothetical protein
MTTTILETRGARTGLVRPDVTFATIPMRADVIDDETERRRLEALGDRTFPAFAPYRKHAAEVGRTVPIVQLIPANDIGQEPA